MANTAFQTVATNPITNQPVSATRIYFRSTNAADTANVSIYGTVSAAPDFETNALTGTSEVITTDSFSAISQVIMGNLSSLGTVTGYAPGTAAVGDIRGDTLPTDGNTLTLGGRTYRFKNTLAAAYDVKIGADLAATMFNLCAAINANGTPGTEYYTGTLVNPMFSGTLLTLVITITDRIACRRASAYVITESSTNFSIRTPIGGVDGMVLFSIATGVAGAADGLVFSTEDLSDTTLPALMLGTSDYVQTNGGQSMYRLYADNALTVKFQSSTDLENWHDTDEGNISVTADTWQSEVFTQLHDFLRMVIVTNANTTNTVFDARVIY
jgi:hypothetical protein